MARGTETTRSRAADYLRRLDGCGWFGALPAAARRAARAGVARALAADQPPWTALVSVVIDAQYLLKERPYSALLRQFDQAAGGRLRLRSVREGRLGDGVALRFDAGGGTRELELPDQAEEVPPRFLRAVNGALDAAGSPLRFLEVRGLPWGPLPSFVLTTPAAYEAAAAAGLLSSRPEEISDEDMEGFALSLESALLGQETYYWVVDRQTLGEMRVPRRFGVEVHDERGGGGGVETVLSFERYGTVFLHCAGEPGAPFPLPRGFTQEEERALPGRTVRTGRKRLRGESMRWRFDTLSGVPIHVGCLVVERMAEPFLEAVQSFRVRARTAAARRVLASCRSPRVRGATGRDRRRRATKKK